jgi:hypothetical protein
MAAWHTGCLLSRNENWYASQMTSEIQGAGAIPAAPASSVQATTTAEHKLSFHDVLSAMNPLQYLPVVGTIYRAVTGDAIPEALRRGGSMLVSGLLGGPIGLTINIATTLAEKVTGIDPEKIVTAELHRAPAVHAPPSDVGPPPVVAQPQLASQAVAQLPMTSAQLASYGVRSSASGSLKLGDIEGADVLNTIQLAALSRAAAAYAANQAMPPANAVRGG